MNSRPSWRERWSSGCAPHHSWCWRPDPEPPTPERQAAGQCRKSGGNRRKKRPDLVLFAFVLLHVRTVFPHQQAFDICHWNWRRRAEPSAGDESSLGRKPVWGLDLMDVNVNMFTGQREPKLRNETSEFNERLDSWYVHHAELLFSSPGKQTFNRKTFSG